VERLRQRRVQRLDYVQLVLVVVVTILPRWWWSWLLCNNDNGEERVLICDENNYCSGILVWIAGGHCGSSVMMVNINKVSGIMFVIYLYCYIYSMFLYVLS
jgi:hypothetical protein